MLKVTLGTLTTIFCIVALIVVFYWRDIGFEPSSKDLAIFFIALPILLTVCILSPLYIMKWLEHRKIKAEEAQEQAIQEESGVTPIPEIDPTCIELQIYSSHCIHTFGEDAEIKQAIQEFSGPELDQNLTNQYGLPIVSYRIQDLELIDVDEDIYASELQQRLLSLIKGQFDYYYSEIISIIEHIKKSTLFYDRQLAYEYKIHPAWINPNNQAMVEDVEEEVLEEVTKLSYFNIHIILSESHVHSFDEVMTKELLEEELFNLGILRQQVRVYFHYWDQKLAYQNWLEQLKASAKIEDEICCFIVVDSDINQEILDEKSYIRENYIPSEFACSCLVGSSKLIVEDLVPDKLVYIIENEKSLKNSLSLLKLEESSQFESEQPFVMILDSIEGAKVSKQLNQFFSETLIETQHFLLIKQSLGHTQTLSDVWGSILGMQTSEDKFSLVFGLKYPQIQLFILPKELENSLAPN